MEKTVYVVHCVDTEGPLAESLQATFQRAKEIFNLDLEPSVETLQKLQRCEIDLGGIEQEVAKVFNPKLLGYHQDWPSIDQMLDEIMSAEFRNKRSDSAGNGWLFNWHCIDHFGFTDNPRGRDMKIHAVFDHYRQRPDLADDSVQFHHHPVGFFHQAHKPATNYLSYQPNIFKLLAHKIIDRQWFPSVYRPGFHTTRPDSHWFLEQYIPFEYANQSMKDDNPDHLQQDLSGGRFGDWRRAPQDWTPYHPSHDDYQVPGHCRRWIGRCLNIGTRLRLLDAQSVDLAFEQAQKGEPAILSFTNHDFREISDDIDYVYSLLKQASDKFPEVKFEYQNGLEAMRKGLKLTSPSQKLDFTCRLSDSVLEISSNHNTFGPQPFMAIRTKDGRYLHDNFDFQENFKRWTYHFDDMTVPLEQIDTFGVAANDHYGQTCVVLYDALVLYLLIIIINLDVIVKSILLIGAGNLGSRHLQGIAKLTQAVNVYVVEPNADARTLATSRWHEVLSSQHHKLSFVSLDSLNIEFDFAIVATLSIGRLDIIKRLIELKIPYILSEKVAFQSVHLYQQALDILNGSASEIYLNYIYRLSDPIQNIKQKIGKAKVDLSVLAGDVEMGCNLIHHLDLAAFLNHDAELTNLVLDGIEINDSNRRHSQLKSFYGVAEAEYANGARLSVRLVENPQIDCTLDIRVKDQSYLINETQGQLFVNNQLSANFVAPRVSDTTTRVIEELEQGRCILPTLAETFTVNKLMLDNLNRQLCGSDDASIICPIT